MAWRRGAGRRTEDRRGRQKASWTRGAVRKPNESFVAPATEGKVSGQGFQEETVRFEFGGARGSLSLERECGPSRAAPPPGSIPPTLLRSLRQPGTLLPPVPLQGDTLEGATS